MPRKNIALEITLVVVAVLAAFAIQLIVTRTTPPRMPEFGEVSGVKEGAAAVESPSVVSVGESEQERVPEKYSFHLSTLGVQPDWTLLDGYQYAITKVEFERLLKDVYTVGDYWQDWFEIGMEEVVIRMSAVDSSKVYKLSFKNEVVASKVERYWRTKSELDEVTEGEPLKGLRIAIDPGHIGGDFSLVEQRHFVLSDGDPPVQEGNMTLIVAEGLVRQLEALGASVSLVRGDNEPVNPLRAADYYGYAESMLKVRKQVVTAASVKRAADKLFYRNGEIRERARLVNTEIRPDLVLCLHFNADSQPDPDKPILMAKEHFHMILNGAYTEGELAHDDERFKCVLKMVQGNHVAEAKMAKSAAASFAAETGLPAYQYAVKSSRAVNVDGNPYLWARNLAANRLYDCPVLYFEPYLMNGRDSYVRMQMGDFEGLRYVNGKLRASIYREYNHAVTKGLVAYFTAKEEIKKDAERVDESDKKLQEGVE